MTNYRQVSDETKKLFYEVVDNTAIPQWVEVKIVADDTLVNKDGYLVRKQNDLSEWLTDGLHVVVIINEDIFDGLEETDVQMKFFEEALGGVVADNEKVKVKVNKPDFATHSGFLEKHGADDVLLLKLAIQSLYEQRKLKEDEEKAQAKLDAKATRTK